MNFDIANSQPMFLGLVLHAPFSLKNPMEEENGEKILKNRNFLSY